MRYRAVIFDLFGTLVDDLGGTRSSDVFARMASALSVSIDDLGRLWSDTGTARRTGVFHTNEANLLHICRELGVQPDDNDVRRAAQARKGYKREVMTTPREGAVEVLSELRGWGYRIGLVSDCTPDAPEIWPETSLAPLFDVAVFSCVVGFQKPDSRIYELAVGQLGVDPKDCLYVGNGGSDELRGACEVGMHPVLVVPPADSTEFLFVASDEVVTFARKHGDVISSLAEVLTLVG
jgi:putative hydrolase of the HAD superfamily